MREEIYTSVCNVADEAHRESLLICEDLDFSIFKNIDSILIIRSCPTVKFENFIKKLYEVNKDIKLTIIGKNSDRQFLDMYYENKYTIYNIDGKYSADSIKQYEEALKSQEYGYVLMYSKVLMRTAEYMNIYQCVEALNISEKVIVFDYIGNLTLIKNISEWNRCMSVIEALCEWIWREEKFICD